MSEEEEAIRGAPESLVTPNDTGAPFIRKCSECRESIPAKRLKAVPTTKQCVPCLELMGDVPRIRRYDEYTVDGDKVETLFTNNKSIEIQIGRMAVEVPSDEDFFTANQDDSHLSQERQGGLDVSRHMSTEFEEEGSEANSEACLTSREVMRMAIKRRWASIRVAKGIEQEGDREMLGLPESITA